MLPSLFCCLLLGSLATVAAAAPAPLPPPIVIETEHLSLALAVGENQKLYQTYLGPKLRQAASYARLPRQHEAYPPRWHR